MSAHLTGDLTRNQYLVAEFVRRYQSENEQLPTLQEIADGIGIPHRANVAKIADRLLAKGYLERLPGRFKNLRTTAKWELRRRREFGIASNPMVMEVVDDHPDVFANWDSEQLDRLLSRRACGGALTYEGVLHEARKMNEIKQLLSDLNALLEIDSARTAVSELVQGLKDKHTPRRRRPKK